MTSCVYPIVILLILGFLTVGALDDSSSDFTQSQYKYSSLGTRDNSARRLKRPGVAKIKLPVVTDLMIARNKSIVKKGVTKFSKVRTKPIKASTGVITKNNKLAFVDLSANTKTELASRERPKRQKNRMNQATMALLMAYKLKFAALIPAIIGGTILLFATTTLAGFFFALFAAVLGLKVH